MQEIMEDPTPEIVHHLKTRFCNYCVAEQTILTVDCFPAMQHFCHRGDSVVNVYWKAD